MADDKPTTDFGTVYAVTRDALVDQLRALDATAAGAIVPACPEWSIKDVVAHVAGLTTDVLAGAQPPLGTLAMTTRQVSERADATLADICDEWQGNGSELANFMADNPLRAMGLTADLTVHQGDIAEVAHAVSPPPLAAVTVACKRYVPLLQERVAERLDIALAVTLDDESWHPEDGATAMSLTATRVDLMRSVTGRRRRAEVEQALHWDGDATQILDEALLQYGPYRA